MPSEHPTIGELRGRNIGQNNYRACHNNDYYCEMSVFDEQHLTRRHGATEMFWQLRNAYDPDLETLTGGRYICNNCYLALGFGSATRAVPTGPAIKRGVPA